MEDALWKLLGILLAVVLVVVIPTMSMLERQDDITLAIVQAETTRFADTVRDMGHVSPAMYERFVGRLHATGLRYDIRLRHERHAWQPEYETTAGGLVFSGRFYRSSMTEGEETVLSVLYPADPSPEDATRHHYALHAGDLWHVEVQSRGATMAAGWRTLFLGRRQDGIGILARAGGMVRNEAP